MQTNTASTIAANLEATFARSGFAEPGVAALREGSGVTLRTLYRHFPSREAMVVGALRHRHDRYLRHLGSGGEASGPEAILTLFDRVADWMRDEVSNGCLFAQAVAAHPASEAIAQEVARYRSALRVLFVARVTGALPDAVASDRERIADGLFLLHEGQVQASATLGTVEAKDITRIAAATMLGYGR